ncbi:MAG: hypothetical protein HUU06_04235 [Planctomycetaceae bacterium]|nr:hypothetical protein [Planctomycetota bacterium]NUN51986.1 hypothetical protein [Planctomycetaceae bacterium]
MRAAPLLLLLAVAVPAAGAPPAPAEDPAKLLQAFFKAKKEEDRAKARAAVEAVAPLEAKGIPALRESILKAMAKAGRSVPPKGRNEWFQFPKKEQEEREKRKLGNGLFYSQHNGTKGLVLGLHGGGVGSGDAGSAQSAFSGVVGSLGLSGIYPEVLEKTECGWIDPPETERWVMELVKRARVSWGVDPDRIYVTGHSMGGFGAWIFGSHYADAFAGAAAFAGAPRIYWQPGRQDVAAEAVVEGYLPNLYNLPLFVFQSLDDQNVKAAANVFACRELKKLHESDPKGWKFLYEEVDGLGHGFPKKGPKPGLEWTTGNVRDSRPEKIVWQPTREWKNTFYWLRWEKPWINSELVATLDRARNAVDVVIKAPRSIDPRKTEAERDSFVRGLSVYLDERVLDPAREVLVTVDGKTRFRGRPEARLGTLLRSCEEREDPAYAFALEARCGDVIEAAATGK